PGEAWAVAGSATAAPAPVRAAAVKARRLRGEWGEVMVCSCSVATVALGGGVEAAGFAAPGGDDRFRAVPSLEHRAGALGAGELVDPADVLLGAAVLSLAPVDLVDIAQQGGEHMDAGAHRLVRRGVGD